MQGFKKQLQGLGRAKKEACLFLEHSVESQAGRGFAGFSRDLSTKPCTPAGGNLNLVKEASLW